MLISIENSFHLAYVYQMGAGNNYVGPLQSKEKQRQAKHQMGRLFQQTSGATLVQSSERQKWVESVGKPVERC